MEAKIFRTLIWFFLGIIALFLLFIAVDFFGNTPPEGKEPVRGKLIAENLKGTAKYQYSVKPGTLPFQEGGATASMRSEGAIRIVREKDFNGVAERPKGMLTMLREMSNERKKPAPIRLSDSDLQKKVGPLSPPVREPRLNGAPVPEPGRKPGNEGVTLITAPVDYKVFKSAGVWRSFTDSRKLKRIAHDFSSADLLILVSVSDFPSGIFKITGLEKGEKETVVKYRVDPLAMSSESSDEDREAYAGIAVPKNGPTIRLEQVP